MTHVCILHVHVCIDVQYVCVTNIIGKLFFFCKLLWIKSHLASAKYFIVKKCKCTVYCLIIPQDCFEALAAAAAGSQVTCKNIVFILSSLQYSKVEKTQKDIFCFCNTCLDKCVWLWKMGQWPLALYRWKKMLTPGHQTWWHQVGHKDCVSIPVSQEPFFPQTMGLQYMYSLSSAPSMKD